MIELKNNSGSKADPVKNRVILDAALTTFEQCVNDKTIVSI